MLRHQPSLTRCNYYRCDTAGEYFVIFARDWHGRCLYTLRMIRYASPESKADQTTFQYLLPTRAQGCGR